MPAPILIPAQKEESNDETFCVDSKCWRREISGRPWSDNQGLSTKAINRMPEFTYPKGLLLRGVNNSGDISWHKNRVFISEVFRFEEFGVELITPRLYRVFFRDMEIGELNSEELRFRVARRAV
jgi:hypothetical protein